MESFVLPSNILTFILITCAVLITGAVVIGVYFILGIIKDVQQLIVSVRGEVENFRTKRRGIEVDGKTFFKFAKIVLSWIILRRK